jgi:hypothetical protein
MKMSIQDKLDIIFGAIKDIAEEDSGVGAVLMESFGIGLRTLEQVALKGGRETIEASEQIEMVSAALGFSLADLVRYVVESGSAVDMMKEPDQQTLDFITSELDDYEKFIAETKAKEDLNFLAGKI